jgi:predicted O-linked N-acetylglucosamine transferase (SPINDLY family)
MGARAVADQRLDVLVELGGYTGHSRVGICLYKPALIQMSYLGFPGATYLDSVPGWIGDEVLFKTLHPLEAKQHQLNYIKGGYMTLPRPNQCPEVNRASTRYFRFGSLNHARKLTEQTINLWSDLLKVAPKAELVLKSFSFIEAAEQQRIRQRFERAGIQPARILLLPWADDHEAHLEQYNEIDVALDPIPYGGATTTAEALWMGVPVICQQTKGMVGSLSASLLMSAGMTELIQTDGQSYINCALNYYNNGIRNDLDRQTLIKHISSSNLNQPRRVSSQLESIFQDYRSSLKLM